ncbi:MAG: hypothetical protein ACPGXX_03465 [Planctomycetaceae bacterium]
MMERFVTCSMPLLICVLSTGCNGFQAPVPLGLNQLLKRSYLTDRQDYNETADPFLYSGAEPEQEITGRTGLGENTGSELAGNDPSLPGPQPIHRVNVDTGNGIPGTGIAHAVYPGDAASPTRDTGNAGVVVQQSFEGAAVGNFLRGQPANPITRQPVTASADTQPVRSAIQRIERPLSQNGALSPAADAAALNSLMKESPFSDASDFSPEPTADPTDAELFETPTVQPAPASATQESGIEENPFSALDGFPTGGSASQPKPGAGKAGDGSFQSQFGSPTSWRPAATQN